MRYFLLTLSLFAIAFAQNYNSIAPPNTFQSEENPYYWGNKKPSTDYWQQDVYYKIHATISEKTDIIDGREELTYWNNSPDTLTVVYFHLYQNAFQPNSYYDNLYHNNHQAVEYGHYEEQGLGTEINYIAIDGKEVKTTLDNTVLIVHLNEAILPHTSVKFDINFKTYYDNGTVRRRMKIVDSYGKKQYNGCHWYPRIAVYDKKFGWTTDQHLGREFYGDFGTYDVTLNFANDYIVAATGNLLNRAEVLPEDLRAKLDITNFKDKPWGQWPSTIIPYEEGVRKEWRYYAENVHDFAFTANPHYRIGEAEWVPENDPENVKKTYSFAQEPHASGWQNAADYSAKIIQVLSEDVGMYGYHKMIVADAQDGMEYPMLTLDGGRDPSYRGLLIHEIAHNWFYGMVNNNETYRAFMDEGFTQFYTSWVEEAIDGKHKVLNKSRFDYINKFREPREVKESTAYYGYMRDAVLGKDPQLNTHSDGFNGAIRHGGGYGHVYSKTATMLYNLQYVLGDELFENAMKYYFQKWSFGHPYPEDFRQSIIEYTKADLNWFFDQWLETNKSINYKVGKVKKVKNEENTFEITLKRKGRMQMPIDFQVVDKKNRRFNFYVPNQYFEKETAATTLAKWTGWDNVNPSYKAKVTIPEAYKGQSVKVKDVIIDPSERLADVNILNNSKKNRIDWRFDSHVWNYPDWKKYKIFYRPDVWWNAYDGIKLGWHLNGNYLNRKHIFSATVWYNTRLAQGNLPSQAIDQVENKYYTNDRVSYTFQYNTALDKFIPDSEIEIQSRYLDGLRLNKLELSKSFPKNISIYGNVKDMKRYEANDVNYLLYPNEWSVNKSNTSINVGMKYDFKNKKNTFDGSLHLSARSSASKDVNYQYAELEYKETFSFWRMDLRTRIYGRYGSKGAPAESALYLAGANGEELIENKYTRASGFVPNSWIGEYGVESNHFQQGGGLNLRGYAGALVLLQDNANASAPAYRGNSGAAISMELDFDRIIKWQGSSKLKTYLDIDAYIFGDAGLIRFENTNGANETSNVMADFGVGTTLTIKRFWFLYNVKPLTIRFDMPFFVSNSPFEDDQFKFRWVLGINRAF